jgi:tRNA threonylcarbamoyladenosine biosynthesis protein TsaB
MGDRDAPGADRGALAALAFDTAGSACSVAVGRGELVLAHERREMRHGHAEALLPMIDRVVEAANLVPADLGVVAVSVGPGGFTGIRAGLAAAQGLALASRARLVGVTSFAAVAALTPKNEMALVVALDSRREDLYIQLFDAAGYSCGEPATVLPAELDRVVAAAVGDAPLRIAGDAVEPAAAALNGRVNVTVIVESAPDALGVLAAARLRGGAAEMTARPLYLRPPDISFPKTVRRVGGVA